MTNDPQMTCSTTQKLRWMTIVTIILLLLSGCIRPFETTQDAPVAVEANAHPETGGDSEPAPRPFHSAPDFTLATLEGGELTLSDLKGQAVILNFWATWCGPCRIEMPELERTFASYQDDGLMILGVNLTQRETDVEHVAPFVNQFGLSFPIVLDEEGMVAELYEVRGQPASVFIDRNGVIQMVWYGPVNRAFIEKQVAGLLES